MKYLLFVILFSSCSLFKYNNTVNKFEEALGTQELLYLNDIVSDFDTYLIDKYPNNKSKFKNYLTDIADGNALTIYKIDSLKMLEYMNSDLFIKFDTIFPDTVWFDGEGFYGRYNFLDFSMDFIVDSFNSIEQAKRRINIDSTINFLKTQPEYFLKKQSNFSTSLDSIKEEDSLVLKYLKAKELIDDIHPKLLASNLYSDLVKRNEYFAKRIFIMENITYSKMYN